MCWTFLCSKNSLSIYTLLLWTQLDYLLQIKCLPRVEMWWNQQLSGLRFLCCSCISSAYFSSRAGRVGQQWPASSTTWHVGWPSMRWKMTSSASLPLFLQEFRRCIGPATLQLWNNADAGCTKGHCPDINGKASHEDYPLIFSILH